MEVYPERQKRQKTRFMCNFNGKSVFRCTQRYYATPRHNPRSDFYKNGLKSSARLEEKKVKKFQREKITTGRDITKNVEGGGRIPPPALLGLKIILKRVSKFLYNIISKEYHSSKITH